ncbi:ABC transporter permease [candidate division KSB3 bacterium]|uniref:ABC transporter permease n=1 Tax=candidate division KSB3 bacterium TaxID=2044937 RepID=A0A2G6E370_9BACT|nr:MAG: ABC transporter permease [candidate division KSB3 bacterium]PIE29112.1 MAG: ABC transporter permease [candidate division KSB3 bacterium]
MAQDLQRHITWKTYAIHLFPLPAFLVYTLFITYPIVAAFSYSLFDWNGLQKGAFSGVKNFVTLFTLPPYNELFWNAFGHNIYYFALEMLVQNGIAFLLAYIIYLKIKGARFFKVAFFLPRLLSVIVVGFLWKLILNPYNGVLNVLLERIGLAGWQQPWLGEPNIALTAVILVNSWFGMGFAMLIFLAGLQSIPLELVEAAKIDGARGLRLIRSIVLPLMRQSLIIMTVFTFIHAFEAFELVYAMQGSEGEPFHSTDTLAVYFYRIAFGASGDMVEIGLGSALAVILFSIIACVSAIFLYVVKNSEIEY